VGSYRIPAFQHLAYRASSTPLFSGSRTEPTQSAADTDTTRFKPRPIPADSSRLTVTAPLELLALPYVPEGFKTDVIRELNRYPADMLHHAKQGSWRIILAPTLLEGMAYVDGCDPAEYNPKQTALTVHNDLDQIYAITYYSEDARHKDVIITPGPEVQDYIHQIVHHELGHVVSIQCDMLNDKGLRHLYIKDLKRLQAALKDLPSSDAPGDVLKLRPVQKELIMDTVYDARLIKEDHALWLDPPSQYREALADTLATLTGEGIISTPFLLRPDERRRRNINPNLIAQCFPNLMEGLRKKREWLAKQIGG
jgi:hypothetical protein